MKILIIAYHYSFSDSTGSLRPRAMAKYLPINGVEVAVLTYSAQCAPVSFVNNIIGVKDITRETVSLPVYYAWRIWQKARLALGLDRGVYEYWRNAALNQAGEIIDRVKPDAILASYPCVEALEIGVSLSEKFGLPLISDFRDGLLFESLEVDRLAHPATRRYYEAIEAKVIEKSRLVITVSEPISSYFRQHYGHTNVMTLHNGFDRDDIIPDININLPDGIINIVHTGRLSASEKGRGVDALCDALRILLANSPELSTKFQLHFVGLLSQAEQICFAPLVAQNVVKMWGHQPRAKALAFQHKANVLLLITAPDKASVATGKIFEYLAAAKPILGLTRGTEAARIIAETGAGIVVSPDKPDQIAEAIKIFINQEHGKLNTRNEDLISSFSRQKQMELIAIKLKEL